MRFEAAMLLTSSVESCYHGYHLEKQLAAAKKWWLSAADFWSLS